VTRISNELRDYFQAIAWVVGTMALSYLAEPHARPADHAMIQVLAIVLLAARFSVRVSLTACFVSILAFDFVFVEPRFAFAWGDVESAVIFAAMLVVAAVTSSLNQKLRRAAFRAERGYELNVELSRGDDPQQLAAVTAKHLESLFGGTCSVILQDGQNRLSVPANLSDPALVTRAWERREFSVHGSLVLLPLLGSKSPIGLIVLHARRAFAKDSEQGHFLSACASQLVLALERLQLVKAVHRSQLEAETERLRSSLLSAVSHDLKTPLSSIIAAGTTLCDSGAQLESNARQDLLTSMVSEAERLNRLLENLLYFARLESSTIELNRIPESIEEVVHSAVERFQGRLEGRRVELDLPDDLPLISGEALLLEQVLLNLLENAARYAGRSATIFISARERKGLLSVRVADDGPGILESERGKVFEKFYRGNHSNRTDGGVGLGLTICRAIVEAHGGRIRASARAGGGALIEFTLPLAELPQIVREAS